MATRYPDSKDQQSDENGREFQDFCCVELARVGIVVQLFSSRRYQFEQGESVQGVEMKLDRRCTETGRLSIEIAEKTRADQRNWITSGIYRQDNTWLYVQGNSSVIYVFAKTTLRLLHGSKRYEEHETATVRAFYLSLQEAERYAARVIRPSGGN